MRTPEPVTALPPRVRQAETRRSLIGAILGTAFLPLFFVLLLTTTFTSASHDPAPHQMSITVAGPAPMTEQIRSALARNTGRAFDISTTTNVAHARTEVATGSTAGALLLSTDTVTVVTASAGGSAAAAVIEHLGTRVATDLDATMTVEDAAPLSPDDATGTAFSFFFITCTIGGFLSIIGPSQVRPPMRTRRLLTTNAVAGVSVPLLAYAVISLFVSDLSSDLPTLSAVLAIAMLYTFTVGLIASLSYQLFGAGGILAIMVLVVAVNLPSSGSTSPEPMLPPFWQVLHRVWFGAGGFEAMRNTLYFDGASTAAHLTQLGTWTIGVLLLVVVTALIHKRRDTPPNTLPPPPRHETAHPSTPALRKPAPSTRNSSEFTSTGAPTCAR